MELKEIYHPISKELSQVQRELEEQIISISKNHLTHQQWVEVNEVISYFFNIPGKHLRPALVLLSAKSVNHQISTINRKLIHLATAVELIHSATLIHDDIVDNSVQRRGQRSLNKQFGNKIAVVAGDMLYARAFSLLTGELDRRILRVLAQCVEEMCRGEISELRPSSKAEGYGLGEYLKIIAEKTASFMSACCKTGAMLALQGIAGIDLPQKEKQISMLQKFGHNFGISYQILDDYLDDDSPVPFKMNMVEKAEEFASRAKHSIEVLEDSIYKQKLSDLVDYILRMDDYSYMVEIKTLSGK